MDDIEIIQKKTKDSPNAGIPRMTIRFRNCIDKTETDAKFKKIWAKLRNLMDSPQDGVKLAAIKLYLSYVLGMPKQEIFAQVDNMSPADQCKEMKRIVEDYLGIMETPKEENKNK